MRFAFTEDQRALAAGVREILTRECTPARVRAAWEPDAPLAIWPHLARAGVTTMTAPEQAGGLGLGELEWVLVAEECGRFALAEPLVEHVAVAVPLLPAEMLREVVVVALDGAPFVSDAARADLIIVERNGGLVAVERRDATITPVPAVDGARQLARVEFAKATTIAADLALAFDRGALAAAAQLLGIARHLIDVTVEYVKIRTQFGRPVGSFQAVKHHLADAHVAIERARPCVYAAAWAIAHRAPERSLDVSLAKALASDAARLAARTALQCHGAIGYSFEHDLHLWMKRAWALAVAWRAPAWHRARIGAALV